MTSRVPRLAIVRRGGRAASGRRSSWTERVLQNLGAQSTFADAILGDLAEQRAKIAGERGAIAAGWWYIREALRCVPHLIRNAVLHGGRGGRARVAALMSAVALLTAVTLGRVHIGNGPPARLVIGSGDTNAGLIVNSLRPMQMSTLVFDADGHALPSVGVRYRWTSGAPVNVTPGGVVTCTQSGDASIHASLDAVTTTTLLHCRPVKSVRAPHELHLVVGGPAHDVAFEARGPDGRAVTLLAGSMFVRDSTVATLEGQRILARAPGMTWVTTRLGDGESETQVQAYARATSPEGIRRGERLAVPVQLASGELRRWRLPASRATYVVTMVPDGVERSVPNVAITGANCVAWSEGQSFLCAAPRGANVFVYRPRSAQPASRLSGVLAVWRQPWP